MDIYSILVITLTSLFIGIVNNTISVLFEFFIRLFLTVVEIKSSSGVRNLDKYLLKKNNQSDVTFQNSVTEPRNTFHLRRVGWGFIIAVRHLSNYNHNGQQDMHYVIYTFANTIINLKEYEIFPDNSLPLLPIKKESSKKIIPRKKFKISNFESPSPWRTDFFTSQEEMSFSSPFEGQEKCILKIRKFNAKSILLCGEPGVGKTNVSLFLAKELNAHVVLGYDLTACGMSLEELWKLNPCEEEPVILVLDEIDTAFANAENNTGSTKFRSFHKIRLFLLLYLIGLKEQRISSLLGPQINL